MMDEMPDTADIIKPIKFERVTRVPHVFAREKIIPACDSIDGMEHHERKCVNCPLARVTVIPPPWSKAPAWREYHQNGEWFLADIEPECVPTVETKREAV